WRFGDAGQIAVQRSVFNAVVRGGPGARVRIEPEDLELLEGEQRTEAATALLLDLSFSMPLRGHDVHAKRMALALHALIEGRHPHDTLCLIAFSDYARRMQPRELAGAGWERVYGTNMHHAFHLAGRLLAQHPRATRQVIMVTDGEPTAHLEGERAHFAWPPIPKTIRLTLAEATRLSRSGVTLNVFMLEDSPGLIRFMERLGERTGGGGVVCWAAGRVARGRAERGEELRLERARGEPASVGSAVGVVEGRRAGEKPAPERRIGR